MYVIADATLDLVLNYQRYDWQTLDPTFTELNNLIKGIHNWEYIKLEKELFESILIYDMYAVRVVIDDVFVGYIDKCNSPVVHWFLDYTVTGVCELFAEATPLFEGDTIKKVSLHLKVTTESEEFYQLVEHMKLVEREENEEIYH